MTLKKIEISKKFKKINSSYLPSTQDGIIYAGKKTELIIPDQIDGNKAMNNTREIMGRIPGLNIVESESSGFIANGISTRGLNPTQSIEMNVRQNGYNISADVNGYNETYYVPPIEAVSRVEFVRGASSIQFGSQFGGLINYILTSPPPQKVFSSKSSITTGSYGLFNIFNSFGGTKDKLSYSGYLQYRIIDGWRKNSKQYQLNGFGSLQYTFNKKFLAGIEYSILRNGIKMPGGLTDSIFAIDPHSSNRSRNWLKSPWNIITSTLKYYVSSNLSLQLQSSILFSKRALVWFDPEKGASVDDVQDDITKTFQTRDVEKENVKSITNEARLIHNYKIKKVDGTLSFGLRSNFTEFFRQEGGLGTSGSDFNLSVTGAFHNDIRFKTNNFSVFAENIFKLSPKFLIVPGFRFEYINNMAKGYVSDTVLVNTTKKRSLSLFAIGSEYRINSKLSFYQNISGAYRPIDYAQLSPIGVSSMIDPNMKDEKGFNIDFGIRGEVNNILHLDCSIFYIGYNNRVGTISLIDSSTGEPFTYRTNVGNSVHKGFESYIEWEILNTFKPSSLLHFSIFNSFGFTDARYTSGSYKNNRVETAVKFINRTGLKLKNRTFSTTLLYNITGSAFGDANNIYVSSNPIVGFIPGYHTLDLGGSINIKKIKLKAGINNILNSTYFTRRTDEYPGPGILPSEGRNFYLTLELIL
ncbi:MAG: TonB-dependent receptor [Ginsengibacter sp.]